MLPESCELKTHTYIVVIERVGGKTLQILYFSNRFLSREPIIPWKTSGEKTSKIIKYGTAVVEMGGLEPHVLPA